MCNFTFKAIENNSILLFKLSSTGSLFMSKSSQYNSIHLTFYAIESKIELLFIVVRAQEHFKLAVGLKSCTIFSSICWGLS
mmetsp:Transcript_19612/g.29712  ORF Transcript_19612/g.29712 Transcript_19612/m.29712 type:complete len:81 (+) Transcript_19612:57-299(+)